jgi:transcriptional regulator with XRE-family HTH domain
MEVNTRSDVREFLASRRARLTPEQAGLPVYGMTRRVGGLRREEVALLAGVSVDYYNRVERGNLKGVSESVLNALARALQLDEAERAHLFDLAGTANATIGAVRRDPPVPRNLRPGVRRVLEALTGPAWVRNNRLDMLAANALGRALYSPAFDDPVRPVNTARFTFLDARATSFFLDWDLVATEIVGVLRGESGRSPFDAELMDLVGELCRRSSGFRTRWAAHDVHFHRGGFTRLRHPVVGDLDLSYEALEFPSDPGLTLLVYSAEPGSSSRRSLDVLARWAVSLPPEQPPATGPEHV